MIRKVYFAFGWKQGVLLCFFIGGKNEKVFGFRFGAFELFNCLGESNLEEWSSCYEL